MSQDQPLLALLAFRSVWKSCLTRKFEYESILKLDDSHTLEGARELSCLRRLALEVRDVPLLEQVERWGKRGGLGAVWRYLMVAENAVGVLVRGCREAIDSGWGR